MMNGGVTLSFVPMFVMIHFVHCFPVFFVDPDPVP